MATRFKSDVHLRTHVELAMRQLTTNDGQSQRYSVPSVHHLLKQQGYIVAFDRVAAVVWAIQAEERDTQEEEEEQREEHPS